MFSNLKQGIGTQSNAIGILADMQSSAVTVRQERCAQVRNRNAHCMKCAEACTSGCISIEGGRLHVDAAKCVGCGTCATVCPTCALETHNPNDAELLTSCQTAAHDGKVAIVCHPLRLALEGLVDTDRVAEVVCLGRVEESLVSRLAADGITEMDLCHGDCQMCSQRHGLDCARIVAESANELLSAWGSSAHVTIADEVPAFALLDSSNTASAQARVKAYFSELQGNEPIAVPKAEHVIGNMDAIQETDSACGRVGFPPSLEIVKDAGRFDASDTSVKSAPHTTEGAAISQDGTRRRSARTSEAPSLLKVMKDGTLPHFLPDRRAKLLDALSVIGSPKTESLRTRLWGCVVINGATCSSCRMCATFCPTGALSKFDNDDGTFGVEHYPGDCVKCDTCREICPEQAISILDDVKPMYLTEGAVHTYRMKPRAVRMNDEHQIWHTMQLQTDGDIWER